MAKNKKYEELAEKVLEYVGGKENISFFTHCVTRLRFNLKDQSKVDIEKINKMNNVIGTKWQSGQLQIIIGQDVGDAYQLICEKAGLDTQSFVNENLDTEKQKFSIGKVFEAISACLTPLLPLLIGAGMIKIIVLLGEQLGLTPIGSDTHIVLTFVGDAGFYFLPIFVGATTARKFGANMGLGLLIGAILVHPTFVASVAAGNELSVFGLPIHSASYGSTIFPVIIAVFIMSYIEKFFAKISPDAIRSIIEPLFTLIVMIPLTLCLIAPIGSVIGVYFSDVIVWLYETTGFLGIALLSAIFPFVVMTGMHAAFAPFMVQSLSSLKFEPVVTAAILVSNLNQGAASAAVAFKSKNIQLKSTAASCAVTALVAGVSEPAMYGVNLKLKKPMYACMIGSFFGGALAGIMQVKAYAFAGSSGLFGFAVFTSPDVMNLVWVIVSCVLGMIITFIVTLLLYKDEGIA